MTSLNRPRITKTLLLELVEQLRAELCKKPGFKLFLEQSGGWMLKMAIPQLPYREILILPSPYSMVSKYGRLKGPEMYSMLTNVSVDEFKAHINEKANKMLKELREKGR